MVYLSGGSMTKKTISLTSEQSSVTFENGTVLELPASSLVVTQFTNDGNGLRSARLPADIDTSPAFDRAMEELGIFEQETIHLDVLLSPRGLRTPTASLNDTVVLRLVPSPSGAEQIMLYQDE